MSLTPEDLARAWEKMRDAPYRPVRFVLPRRIIAPAMRDANVPEEEIEALMQELES